MAVFTRDKAILLTFLTGGHFMTHVMLVAYPVIAIMVGDEWGFTSDWQLMSLITFTGVIYGTGSLATGYLADRRDPLAMATLGLMLSTAGAFGIGLSINFWMMVASFGVMGAGLSFYHPAGLGFISRVFGPKNRGKALGINGVGGDMGMVISPVATVFVAEALGWRAAYLLWGALGLVFVAYAVVLFGTRVLTSGGNTSSNGPDNGAPDGPGSGIARGRLDVSAMHIEERSEPLTGEAYKRGLRALLTTAVLLVMLVTVFRGLLFHGTTEPLPTYFVKEKAVDARVAGVMVSLMYLMGVFSEPLGGYLKDRYSARTPLVAFTLLCTGAIALLVLGEGTLVLTAAGLVFGFAFFASMAVVNALVADVTPPGVRSTFYGVSFFTRDGIGFLAPIMVGAVSDTWGFEASYWMVAAFGLVTAAVALAVERPRFGWPSRDGDADKGAGGLPR
jgi:FSR family fosmidomycin resistance protein-like MFS transporter